MVVGLPNAGRSERAELYALQGRQVDDHQRAEDDRILRGQTWKSSLLRLIFLHFPSFSSFFF